MKQQIWTDGQTRRSDFIGGSDARIHDEAVLIRLWQGKRGEMSGNLVVQLGLATEDLNRRWYKRITGRMSVGRYTVALCYATAVILLGWWPWNILLILPVLRSSNHDPLRFGVFVTPAEPVRSKVFCGRGGSL